MDCSAIEENDEDKDEDENEDEDEEDEDDDDDDEEEEEEEEEDDDDDDDEDEEDADEEEKEDEDDDEDDDEKIILGPFLSLMPILDRCNLCYCRYSANIKIPYRCPPFPSCTCFSLNPLSKQTVQELHL